MSVTEVMNKLVHTMTKKKKCINLLPTYLEQELIYLGFVFV